MYTESTSAVPSLKSSNGKTWKRIAVEEHFSTLEHVENLKNILDRTYPSAEVLEKENILHDASWLRNLDSPSTRTKIDLLCDLAAKRLEQMDQVGIEKQVISLVSPGIQVFEPDVATELSRKCNDILAAAIKQNSKRFVGLACLAPQKPGAAADELERCVRQLEFKGAVINSHTKGEYLDDRKFWPIFERAASLEVPVYIHPRGPSGNMIEPYLGYPRLSTSMWGFAAETSLHALRLICSGLFDELPKVRIILGHLGETIPGMLKRIDTRWGHNVGPMKIRKRPGEYFKQNFIVSTSGMTSSYETLAMTLAVLGNDNVMFATDYPFENLAEVVADVDAAPIDEISKEKIYSLNAERIFSL